MRKQAMGIAAIATVAVGLGACSASSESTSASQSPTSASAAATKSPAASATTKVPAQGSYISLADYQANKAKYADTSVVYFFNASWCPTCQEANKNLNNAKGAMPAGLTVVDVDYDSNTDLKKEYGITVQHTFVEVDANGKMIKKWTGSSTPQQIESEVSS